MEVAFSVWAFSQAASPPRCRRCPNFHLFFLALTVCPYDGGSKTGGRFGYHLLANTTFPSRIIIVCGVRVAETSARKSIDTHYEQPTSPLRPTATGRAEGAFFVSDFSHGSKKNVGAVRRECRLVRSLAQGRRRRHHRVLREMWNLFGKKKTPAEMLRCARDSDPRATADVNRSRRVEPAGTFLFFRADDVWPRVRSARVRPLTPPPSRRAPACPLGVFAAQGEQAHAR